MLNDAALINSFNLNHRNKIADEIPVPLSKSKRVKKNLNYLFDNDAKLKERFKSLEIPATIVGKNDADLVKVFFLR